MDKPLEEMLEQPHSWRVALTVITAMIVCLTIVVLAGYGTWALYDRSNLHEQLFKQTTLAESRRISIVKMSDEIQDLRLSQRWDNILNILLDKDRRTELDSVEAWLTKQISEGTIRGTYEAYKSKPSN